MASALPEGKNSFADVLDVFSLFTRVDDLYFACDNHDMMELAEVCSHNNPNNPSNSS